MPNKTLAGEFAARLFQAQLAYEGRIGRRLTREEFASMVDVSHPTVSAWLNANQLPSIVQVQDIARALGVSPGWLAFGEGVMLSGNHEPPKLPTHPTRTKVESKPKAKRRSK